MSVNKKCLEKVALSLSETRRMFESVAIMRGKCVSFDYNGELVKLLSDVSCDTTGELYLEGTHPDEDLDEHGIPNVIDMHDISDQLQKEVIDKFLSIVGKGSVFTLQCTKITAGVGLFYVTELYCDEDSKYI